MDNLDSQLVLDNIRTAIIAINEQQQIIYVNSSAQSLFNISPLRIHRKKLHSIFSNIDSLQKIIEQAIEDEGLIIQRQVNLRLYNQQEIVLDITVTPTGKDTILEFHSLDRLIRINHEKNIFSNLNSSKKLIRNLAHEIKNPLAGLSGAAQLLERKIKNVDNLDYTKIIIAETKRLTNLVDSLLGPHKQKSFEPTNIHEVLQHVLKLIDVEISNNEDSNIKLIRQYDPSIPEIAADKEQLIQAVLNILKNAMQILFEQGVDGEIIIKSSIERNYTIGNVIHRLACRVDIIDDGPGIAEKHQDSIFLPLVSHRQEGTGLGLAIAQTIVSQHNGLITLQSQPGKTCFSLYLPLSSH